MNTSTLEILFDAMLDENMIQYEADEQKKNLELYNRLSAVGLTSEQMDIVSETISEQAYADCRAGFHAGFMAALDILSERDKTVAKAENYNPLSSFTTTSDKQ